MKKLYRNVCILTALANLTKLIHIPCSTKLKWYVISLPSVIQAETLLEAPPHFITVFWLPTTAS